MHQDEIKNVYSDVLRPSLQNCFDRLASPRALKSNQLSRSLSVSVIAAIGFLFRSFYLLCLSLPFLSCFYYLCLFSPSFYLLYLFFSSISVCFFSFYFDLLFLLLVLLTCYNYVSSVNFFLICFYFLLSLHCTCLLGYFLSLSFYFSQIQSVPSYTQYPANFEPIWAKFWVILGKLW